MRGDILEEFTFATGELGHLLYSREDFFFHGFVLFLDDDFLFVLAHNVEVVGTLVERCRTCGCGRLGHVILGCDILGDFLVGCNRDFSILDGIQNLFRQRLFTLGLFNRLGHFLNLLGFLGFSCRNVGKLLFELGLELKLALLTAIVGVHSPEITAYQHKDEADENEDDCAVVTLVALTAECSCPQRLRQSILLMKDLHLLPFLCFLLFRLINIVDHHLLFRMLDFVVTNHGFVNFCE